MQSLLVLLIVAASALYCLWALLPLPWRNQFRRYLEGRRGSWARRLATVAERPAGACADCGARHQCPARGANRAAPDRRNS
jgi:hypothetical protein